MHYQAMGPSDDLSGVIRTARQAARTMGFHRDGRRGRHLVSVQAIERRAFDVRNMRSWGQARIVPDRANSQTERRTMSAAT